jgi:hypothetical protein
MRASAGLPIASASGTASVIPMASVSASTRHRRRRAAGRKSSRYSEKVASSTGMMRLAK